MRWWVPRVMLFVLIVVVLALAVLSESSLFGGKELKSPSDWVQEEQIKVYPNQIILDIQGATWAGFTNTNSMDPFIDETSNAIEIIPEDPNAIEIGDVISYQTNYGVVIHRVIDKGMDRKGVFYIVQGDNNTFRDPFKVRYQDVKGVVVAVIY